MNDLPTIRVLAFKQEFVPDKANAGKMISRDWVQYAPVSSIQNTQTWELVNKLRPPEFLGNDDEGKKMAFMRHRWSMIEPGYNAWKDGQEIPVDGTALAAWPGVTPEQVQAIQRLGLRTVEEVAAMTDSVIAKLPIPSPRDLVKQARAFLEATDRGAAAKKVADQDAKIEALQEQLAAAMELLEERTSEKPKRGKALPLAEGLQYDGDVSEAA